MEFKVQSSKFKVQSAIGQLPSHRARRQSIRGTKSSRRGQPILVLKTEKMNRLNPELVRAFSGV